MEQMMQKTKQRMFTFFTICFFCCAVLCEAGEHQAVQELQDMTVTAQKHRENIQQVPVSMDAFSDMALYDANIQNTFDLTRFSANVFMKQNYTEHIPVIRGISSFRASTYSPVGFFVNDVSYPLHYFQNTALFDLERVEILKGPQGTLYGRNAESGVINVITKQPDDQFRSKIFGAYGSYDTFRYGAQMSGPIVDETLFLGAAIQQRRSDGFMENQINGDDRAADSDQTNGRVTLRWTPAERWDLSFVADAVTAEKHIGGYRFLNGPKATEPYKVSKDSDEPYQEDGNSQVLRVAYSGERFDVLSVSSALYQTNDKQADADVWSNPADQRINNLKVKEQQYSQELRLSGNRADRLKWLLGGYAFSEESFFNFSYTMVTQGKLAKNPATDVDSTGYAVFGQATYSPWEKLHLTAGLRFDHHQQEGEITDSVKKVTFQETLDNDEVLPKLALSYDFTPDVMGYATVSKGYLAGGFNWIMNPTQTTLHYEPEYTWNYETGIKTSWWQDRLVANLAIFYIDITDKQVTEYSSTTATNTITNAASAHSYGFEFELKAAPLQGLNLFAGIGYTEAQFDDFMATERNAANTAFVENNYSDRDLPYAPRYTGNAGVQYRMANGFFGRADVFATGRFYGDAANTSQQDAYTTVNLRFGYEGKRLDCCVWAENLFDEQYLTYVVPMDKTTNLGLDGAPRTFGAMVTVRF